MNGALASLCGARITTPERTSSDSGSLNYNDLTASTPHLLDQLTLPISRPLTPCAHM